MAQLSPQPGLGHKVGSSQGRGGGVQGGHHLTNCFATPKWARGSIWLGAPLLQEGLRERWCAGLRGAAVCRREGAGDASPLPSFFFFPFPFPFFIFITFGQKALPSHCTGCGSISSGCHLWSTQVSACPALTWSAQAQGFTLIPVPIRDSHVPVG